MRFSAATWLTMVRVERVSISASGAVSFGAILNSTRSAESWIGVSGFLISCASRRATSAQAASRCACNRCVTSSNTTTKSVSAPAGKREPRRSRTCVPSAASRSTCCSHSGRWPALNAVAYGTAQSGERGIERVPGAELASDERRAIEAQNLIGAAVR